MMGAISNKLRSQRGASLLLALLFLLICSMVTASILMAAVSNAGKHRSNLEEHQIYQALSSAVSTLCDELNRSEYRGQYCSWKETVQTGGDAWYPVFTTYSYFRQEEGAYTHAGTENAAFLTELLLDDFDAVFARTLSLPDGVIDRGSRTGTLIPHTLVITPASGTELDNTDVRLTLSVKDSYAIYITAYLDGLETYRVEAELTPSASAPTLPPLSYAGEGLVQQTAPMTWKLGWITILDDDEEGGSGS